MHARSSTGRTRGSCDAGFTMIEMAIVASILFIVGGIAVPVTINGIRSYKVAADARAIASSLALARVRAGADFARAEVVCDTIPSDATYNTFYVAVESNGGSSFNLEGGTQNLSREVTFGYGNIAAGAGNQTTPTQSGAIIFNSRGLPVDASGNPVSTYAVYLNGPPGLYFAATVDVSGKINIYQSSGGAWVLAR